MIGHHWTQHAIHASRALILLRKISKNNFANTQVYVCTWKLSISAHARALPSILYCTDLLAHLPSNGATMYDLKT